MLVARHEPEIGGTTNVADHPEFAARKTTKVIDGVTRRPAGSPRTSRSRSSRRCAPRSASRTSARPTRASTASSRSRRSRRCSTCARSCRASCTARSASTPRPSTRRYFRSLGLPLEPKLVSTLNRNGLNRKGAPVFVQSFEIGNLQALDHVPEGAARAAARRARPASRGRPEPAHATARWRRPPGCARSRPTRTASGRGRTTSSRAPPTTARASRRASSADAHRAGLVVHPYTFRRENTFLPCELRSSTDPGRDRRPRVRDPAVHPGRSGRLLHRQRGLRRPGPLLASPFDAAGRAPRRLPAPVRAARRAGGGRADGRGHRPRLELVAAGRLRLPPRRVVAARRGAAGAGADRGRPQPLRLARARCDGARAGDARDVRALPARPRRAQRGRRRGGDERDPRRRQRRRPARAGAGAHRPLDLACCRRTRRRGSATSPRSTRRR